MRQQNALYTVWLINVLQHQQEHLVIGMAPNVLPKHVPMQYLQSIAFQNASNMHHNAQSLQIILHAPINYAVSLKLSILAIQITRTINVNGVESALREHVN